MSIKENYKALHDDAHEYAERSIDNCKLMLIEYLSLLFGDVACGFVLFMLLFLAFIFMLVAMVALLAPLTGLFLALVIAAAVLVSVSLIVYFLKARLFVDVAVKHLCRILFGDERDEE